ncbi:MAG TPA: glycosyltransferase family 39 protein [Candidatus Solibacter sp.]|nr:glycosyltransferase family 39 protein [Candidatus Solibacter sp.]
MLPSRPTLVFLLLAAIGVARIVATYRTVSQTSDETPNIGCGMQYLDLGRYDYGAFHPPLARLAMAVGPYLYGARAQHKPDRWQEGNAVLNSAPRYGRALTLARIGILPFFVLACFVVWRWGRRLLGEWGGLVPVFCFTMLPAVLAHAGLATMDMAVGAGVCTAFYTFWRWMEEGTSRRSVLLGAGVALAVLSKFSSFMLLPVGFVSIALLARRAPKRSWLWVPVAFLLVWGAYRFSFGYMTEQGPAILRAIPLPAPQILDGIWQVRGHIEGGHTGFLLGQHAFKGWWYFFPVAIAVKTPVAGLLLAIAGIVAAFRQRDRALWMPPLLTLAILAVNLPTTLNIGVRYMLPLFSVLSLTAGIGAAWLWTRARLATAVLLSALAISSALAHPDYIAYFNEFAGAHPERILVDSDLDWGQDMGRLATELRRRNVNYLHLSCLYTGDDTRLGLPNWDSLDPYQPVTGWVALSFTMRENFGWKAAQDRGRNDLAFAWLDRYQPVTRVGKSILLYYLPAN